MAVFQNPLEDEMRLTRFDHCVDCPGNRADYVISHPDARRVVVELKGRDVESAADQFVNTFQYLKTAGLASQPVAALLVCSRVPLGTSSVQRLVGEIKRAGISRLKVKSREWTGTFDELF